MKRADFLKIADKCGVVDLYNDGEAYVSSGNVDDWIECMRAVEQATLERLENIFNDRAKKLRSSWDYSPVSSFEDRARGFDEAAMYARSLKDSND